MATERGIRKEINKKSSEEFIQEYLRLGNLFLEPPVVKLILSSASVSDKTKVGARDVAITTAVQSYAPGIALMRERRDSKSNAIAESTLNAGHLTTRQHMHYTWRFSGTSRSVTHDIFHAHPFYNSEQQSQRFVPVVEGSYLVRKDLTPSQMALYLDAANYSNRAYVEMNQWLRPEIERLIREMYPVQKYSVDRAQKRFTEKGGKLTQELSRYLLPLCQKTTYYHTLSALQVMRLFRVSQMDHFTDEARFVIGSMVAEIIKLDPDFIRELQPPVAENEKDKVSSAYITERKKEFDSILGGRSSVLSEFPLNGRELLSSSVRNNSPAYPNTSTDSQIIEQLLNPKENPHLADIYDTGMFEPATMSLRQVSIGFATKLSHTADSQRQRHRMTPGATPPLEMLYDGTPDYITPFVVKQNPLLRDKYDEQMNGIFERVNRCIEAGISLEQALLLLPNALAVRTYESGNLLDWSHRWRQRLCLLAQEEIFFISVEQVEQVLTKLPEADKLFKAPCGIRKTAGISPRCPEGERWCGQPVFNWDEIGEYQKKRLV